MRARRALVHGGLCHLAAGRALEEYVAVKTKICTRICTYNIIIYNVYVAMKKEERKKQARSNKQQSKATQHLYSYLYIQYRKKQARSHKRARGKATQHTQGRHFSMSCHGSLHSKQSDLHVQQKCMYLEEQAECHLFSSRLVGRQISHHHTSITTLTDLDLHVHIYE